MPFGLSKLNCGQAEADRSASSREESDTMACDGGSNFFSVLTISPSDWQLILNEKLALIDWDSKSKTLAHPCGNFLTLMFFAIRLLQDNLIKPNYHEINASDDAFDFSKSNKLRGYDYLNGYVQKSGTLAESKSDFYFLSLGRLAKALDVSILILLVLNAITTFRFLCTCHKTYSLFYLGDTMKSKNLTKHSLTGLNEEAYYENIINGSLWALLRNFFSKGPRGDAGVKSSEDDDFYYQLRKWSPSKFTVRFFVSFSPTCLIFLLLSEVSFRTAFAVLLHQCVLYLFVVERYENRIIDELIITSAASNEYDQKFLKPRTSKRQQDVQVDATPFGEGFVRFFPSSHKSHIFKSHSISGDMIIEKYNTANDEFEHVPNESTSTHNILIKPPELHPYVLYRDPYGYRLEKYRDNGEHPYYHSREGSPARMSTPPGFYSPVVSTASGMSTPYLRPERSSTYMNSFSARQALNHRKNSWTNDQSRRNSKSPLRQSVTSSRNLENAKNFKADYANDDLKAMGKHDLSFSSRSSSKSPTRKA